jgi:hypothetical protein
LRYGKRYSQKCSLLSQTRCNDLMYLALYLRDEVDTAQFGVLWGLKTYTTALQILIRILKNLMCALRLKIFSAHSVPVSAYKLKLLKNFQKNPKTNWIKNRIFL